MNIFNLESEAQLSPCRRNLFAFTALLIIILSIYSNTFDASWHFDDQPNIQSRSAIHLKQLTWPEIKRTFFFEEGKEHGKLYRPVVNFTLALNYYFGKLDVFGYHLVNISVHIVASMFLFLFVYYTLNLPLLKPRYGSNSYLIALLSTVLWAINPVQTQAITYIVQRMASMAAMFYIMSMYFYLRGRISQKRSQKGIFFLLCLVSGILAVGSKENAAMLPISILIFDLFAIQGVNKASLRKSVRILFILMLVPLLLALILKGPSIFDPNYFLKTYDTIRPFSLAERLLTEPRIILFYISLLLYPMPHRLSLSHDIAISRSFIDPATTVIAIFAILGVLVVCLIKAKRWPFITYCILFFFINHIIEGSVFGLELIFEHRNYLPSMFLFAPLAILLVKGLNVYANRRAMKAVLSVFIILVLVGFGHSTYMRNFDWKTDATLWKDVVKKAPDLVRPRMNLGNCYSSMNMLEKALSEYMEGATKRVGSRKLDRYLNLYNIGLMHHKMGNFDEALKYYQKSIELYPHYPDAFNNMGLMLLKKDYTEKAETAFLEAIRCDKGHIKAHKNLALMKLKDGRIHESLALLERVLQISPDQAGVLGSAGYAYRLRGLFGKAYLLFEKALSFEPHDAKVHLYMAEIFFKRNMYAQAEQHISEFMTREKKGDLRGYIKGTYRKEMEIDMIRKYKLMVMRSLSLKYSSEASYLTEKENYIKETLLLAHSETRIETDNMEKQSLDPSLPAPCPGSD